MRVGLFAPCRAALHDVVCPMSEDRKSRFKLVQSEIRPSLVDRIDRLAKNVAARPLSRSAMIAFLLEEAVTQQEKDIEAEAKKR